ncbi:hypothetical protein [Leucobacter coleopterorum]|uniref:hypothetical protein n=1 Tax=Leucobacter coleopterorum TaxID=2714933 RepID=UPI001FCC6CA9|nr:hypothetical protein [Leucobacter coleopterorum]
MPLRLGHSETSWRRRLRRSTTYPTDREVATYVDAIVKPALAEVVSELRSSGVKCALEITESPVAGLGSLLLTARFDQQKAFTYQVYPVSHERPKYALGDHDPGSYYYRLEVFTASGSHGYDVWGTAPNGLSEMYWVTLNRTLNTCVSRRRGPVRVTMYTIQ